MLNIRIHCVFYIGVIQNNNGGETTDAKERIRQHARERYAEMPTEKKDARNKKRREAYHQKKARASVNTQESQNSASVLSQIQSTPIITGAF